MSQVTSRRILLCLPLQRFPEDRRSANKAEFLRSRLQFTARDRSGMTVSPGHVGTVAVLEDNVGIEYCADFIENSGTATRLVLLDICMNNRFRGTKHARDPID